MAIEFYCPQCRQPLDADPRQVGTQVVCPRCGAEVGVPGPTDWPTPPAGATGPAGEGTRWQAAQSPASPDARPADPPPRTRTSGLAVAALVLCLIPFTIPVGVPLAIWALMVVRCNDRLTGAWMPKVGLIFAVAVPLSVVLWVLIVPEVRETVHPPSCAVNLNRLGRAFRIYAQQNNGRYPAVNPGPNGEVDSRAGLWRMVVADIVPPHYFTCPSDTGAVPCYGPLDPDRPFPRVDRHGRPDPAGRFRSCSYSYQLSNVEVGNPSRENPNSTRFAIMADRAPPLDHLLLLPESRIATLAEATAFLESLEPAGERPARTYRDRFNSPNYGGQGQYVLFQDGHVQWFTHPFCGVDDDNIYTWATGRSERDVLRGQTPAARTGIVLGPFSDDDTVLADIERGRAVLDP